MLVLKLFLIVRLPVSPVPGSSDVHSYEPNERNSRLGVYAPAKRSNGCKSKESLIIPAPAFIASYALQSCSICAGTINTGFPKIHCFADRLKACRTGICSATGHFIKKFHIIYLMETQCFVNPCHLICIRSIPEKS